jgi:hypothetical protein
MERRRRKLLGSRRKAKVWVGVERVAVKREAQTETRRDDRQVAVAVSLLKDVFNKLFDGFPRKFRLGADVVGLAADAGSRGDNADPHFGTRKTGGQAMPGKVRSINVAIISAAPELDQESAGSERSRRRNSETFERWRNFLYMGKRCWLFLTEFAPENFIGTRSAVRIVSKRSQNTSSVTYTHNFESMVV